MSTFEYYKWTELDFKWNEIDLLWTELGFIRQVYDSFRQKRGSGGALLGGKGVKKHWTQVYNELKKEEQEKFIKIYCTVNDIKYDTEKKRTEDIKITVSNLEKVFKKVDVKVNLHN